jgi:hypothetical protein
MIDFVGSPRFSFHQALTRVSGQANTSRSVHPRCSAVPTESFRSHETQSISRCMEILSKILAGANSCQDHRLRLDLSGPDSEPAEMFSSFIRTYYSIGVRIVLITFLSCRPPRISSPTYKCAASCVERTKRVSNRDTTVMASSNRALRSSAAQISKSGRIRCLV